MDDFLGDEMENPAQEVQCKGSWTPFAKVFFSLLIFLGIFLILNHSLFVVREIKVDGVAPSDIMALKEETGIHKGTSLLAINEEKIKKCLDATGYLKLISIKKDFIKGELHFKAQYRKPFLMISVLGYGYVLDKEDHVICQKQKEEADKDLIQVEGLKVDFVKKGEKIHLKIKKQYQDYRFIVDELIKHQFVYNVAKISFIQNNEIIIYTKRGDIITLGTSTNACKKLTTAFATVAKLIELHKPHGRIDVSATVDGEAIYTPLY